MSPRIILLLLLAMSVLTNLCLAADNFARPPLLPNGTEMVKEWKLSKNNKLDPKVQPAKLTMRKVKNLVGVSVLYFDGSTVECFWQHPFIFVKAELGISIADTRESDNSKDEEIFRPFNELRWLANAPPPSEQSGTLVFERGSHTCAIDPKTLLPIWFKDSSQTITYQYTPLLRDSMSLPAEFAAKLAEYQEVQSRPAARLLKIGR